MNAKKGDKVARSIGVVEKLDVNEKGKASGSFLRARVAIELNKPLRRGLFLRDEVKQENAWYEIQYEKLPFFCKSCGILGHFELDCPSPALRGPDGKLPYDCILRAPEDKKKLMSFGESVTDWFSSGSQNSKGSGCSGRSASACRSKKSSSENSTNQVEDEEVEVSSPLKPRADKEEKGESHTSVRKLDLDGGSNHRFRKRKPSLGGGASGGVTPDLNTPISESSELVPAGLVTTRRDQFGRGGGGKARAGQEGLKKQKRSITNERSAAAAQEQPRRAQ